MLNQNPYRMETNYLKEKIVKKNYLCSLIGHRYMLTKKINIHFSEFECSHCKMQVTNDNRGRKITLTSRLKEINETLFYLNLKKQFLSKFYIRKE